MKKTTIALAGLFLLLGAGTAFAQQKSATADDVLAAQYAAKSKPVPMQADEAARIREEYLKNIGKKLSKPATTSQKGSGQ